MFIKQFMQTHFNLWFIYKQFNFILHKGVELVIYLFSHLFMTGWMKLFKQGEKMNEE